LCPYRDGHVPVTAWAEAGLLLRRMMHDGLLL
jgi:hypothetical protein